MMDRTAAVRDKLQHENALVPPDWVSAQAALAAESGLAILLVEGHQPPQLTISNNNSICHAFQSSPAHAHLCEPYCGAAFNRAQHAQSATPYRCHAGLHCFAMPVELNAERSLAVIGGRAFVAGADYRQLVERFRVGDLRDLLSPESFRNVIFSASNELAALATRLGALAEKVRSSVNASTEGEASGTRALMAESASRSVASESFPPDVTLQEACRLALQALTERHQIASAALVIATDVGLVPACSIGKIKTSLTRLKYQSHISALLDNFGDGKRLKTPPEQVLSQRGEGVELFPLVVGDEIKGALLVGDARLSEVKRREVSDFCRRIAMPFEVLRLREELERRMRASSHLQAFSEHINAVDPAEAYTAILRLSTELLRSERGSLLLFDEATNELQVKAAVGPRAEIAKQARVRFGDGVAGAVLRAGRPLVVRNLAAAGFSPASSERSYKSDSFISYPIITGERKIGVLNMTDKTSGAAYDEFDLNLLELITPQIMLALDRAEWHSKATQFQLLSITDPLTSLLNRRYLEERLAEELERSKRHRFPMSFLMIDIDNFKQYNDRHGHQAGDLALEMTAQCVKSALRSADVASRYGGEEFSILLPQTSLAEAQVIAERIRRRVERAHLPHGASQPHGAITISVGISAFGPKTETPATIIGAADQALYAAKSKGKNRVESSAPLPNYPPDNVT